MEKDQREKTDRRMRETRRTDDNIKINSQELQKKFPIIYQEFFNTHDIVLSSDTVLTWGADLSHGISALRIKQKLPIKTFCGANFNNSGKITFRTITHYSSLRNIFKKSEFTTFFKNDTPRIVAYLESVCLKNGFTYGMEIDFLTETPRGHGFAFTGVISTLLGFLLAIVTKKIDTKILIQRQLPATHPIFDDIYISSLELSNNISRGKSIGASIYTIMVPNNPLPTVCFSFKSSVYGKTITQDHTTAPTILDGTLYKSTLLDFLGIKDENIETIPLDYGVVFTGLEHTFDEIESLRESVKKDNIKLNTFMNNAIQSLSIGDDERDTLIDILDFDLNDTSRKNIDVSSIKILEGFDNLFKNNFDDNAVSICIENIKSIGMMSLSYQKQSRFFIALQYLFYKYRQFDDEELGVFPFNTGKIGGSFFFVMKHRKSRATLDKVLSELRVEGHIASLDYASWRDGYSGDGIRVEQNISQKLYSLYTREGNVTFSDTWGKTYFGDYDSVITSEKDCILLDTISGRIHICGKKLTSKDIHSQNTTIDMMKILLENIGKEVPNSKLPVSTYSQNKNEILGKVVLPIKKLSKEHFGKEISLMCSGGITEYYLRLDRDEGVRIGIIKRLGG